MATLLLADESVTVQRVIELTFANEDVRVIAVGDGESAIARFDEDRPDVVLADVGLSGVDGYQMATHVKGSATQVPVLLLTGAFEPVDEDRARATGCDGVLVKPFEPRQLVKTVLDLLAGARPANLWPADMPRLDPNATVNPTPVEPAPTPESVPVPVPEPAPVVEEVIPEPVMVEEVPVVDISAYERVELPVSAPAVPLVSDLDDLPVPPQAESRPLVAEVAAEPVVAESKPASAAPMSLGNVFTAMLAAERQNPDALRSIATSPALSAEAVEEIVQKVLRKMTNEHVRKIVLETAERLIREEIARIKL